MVPGKWQVAGIAPNSRATLTCMHVSGAEVPGYIWQISWRFAVKDAS
jgi:hypothetical protein